MPMHKTTPLYPGVQTALKNPLVPAFPRPAGNAIPYYSFLVFLYTLFAESREQTTAVATILPARHTPGLSSHLPPPHVTSLPSFPRNPECAS